MKRFLAYFCCIFTLLGQSFSCLANDNIVGSTEAGNILYQDSAIILRANSNMSVVECENLSTGTREVAYWEENHVVDRWYENEVLISEKVFDKSSFISEETALDDSLMNSIDKALAEIADKDLTSEMVYNKLMESGIQCTVTAVPDGFIIDPIINNMISTHSDWFPDKATYNKLKRFTAKDSESFVHIETLNDYAHGDYGRPTKDDLLNFWKQIEPIIDLLLEDG